MLIDRLNQPFNQQLNKRQDFLTNRDSHLILQRLMCQWA